MLDFANGHDAFDIVGAPLRRTVALVPIALALYEAKRSRSAGGLNTYRVRSSTCRHDRYLKFRQGGCSRVVLARANAPKRQLLAYETCHELTSAGVAHPLARVSVAQGRR